MFRLLLALSLLWAAPVVAAEPMRDCEVIARVNNEVIQACEVSWEVELMLQQRLAKMPPEVRAQAAAEVDKAREAMTQQLVMSRLDMLLFYADFRSTVPTANVQAIQSGLVQPWNEREVPRLQKFLGAKNSAELKARLAELGTSYAERQQDFFMKSISRAWLTESVEFNREVTHQQLLDYYRDHEADYAIPARAKWEELVVRYDKHGSRAEAYGVAARLGNRAHAVAANRRPSEPAFVELAKAESDGFTAADGGQRDWTTRGAMALEEINDLLFTLPPGQMSPRIVEGPTGFHVVRVLERRDAGLKPFREVQKEIAKEIRDERFDAAVLARVTELKRNARIWTKWTGDIDTARAEATERNTLR